MGRIFNDNGELNNNYQKSSFNGGRVFGDNQPQQDVGSEGIFNKFINYVKKAPSRIGSYFMNKGVSGVEQDVSNFGKNITFGTGNLLSDVAGSLSYQFSGKNNIEQINKQKEDERQKINQFLRNPNIKKETKEKLFKYSQKLNNPLLASQIYDFAKKSNKQIVGESLGTLTDSVMGGIVDKAFSKALEVEGIKPLAKYLASEKGAKYLTKSMISGGLTMGTGMGFSKMAEGGSNEEIRKSAQTGAKTGVLMQPAIEIGGGYAGKLYKKLFKKGEATAEKEVEGRIAKESQSKRKIIDKAKAKAKANSYINIKNIINNDNSISIKKEKSIINPENKKKANGKYQYNYKKKKGTIVVEEGAKNSTLAHEYAHHLNITLGEKGDKLSNNLTNYLNGKGEKPKIFDGFNAKKIGKEIKKIGKKENQSENFATSFSKYIENPRDVQNTGPEFSKFIDEKVIPTKKGKKINWTKSEDVSVEDYIRDRINKARKKDIIKHAKKFKTKKEFIKSLDIFYKDSWEGEKHKNADKLLKNVLNETMFHGTNAVKEIKNTGFNKGVYFNSGTYFADTPNIAIDYMKQARSSGSKSGIFVMDKNNFKLKEVKYDDIRAIQKGYDEGEILVNKLKNKFDGVHDTETGETFIWNMKKINKKSIETLDDLWKKSKKIQKFKTKNPTPKLHKEAQKAIEEGKSFDDFIKAQGTPVYHGTPTDFKKFDIKKAGTNTDSGMYGKGFYFTNSKIEAEQYAKDKGFVKKVYLDMKNPYTINSGKDIPDIKVKAKTIKEMKLADKTYSERFTKHLKDKGYDGVIDNTMPTMKQYVVFDSKQIKTIPQLSKIWEEAKKPTFKFRKAEEKTQTTVEKKLTEKQLNKISEFNKKLFGDENVKITKQIMTPDGQEALGVYSDGMIKILKGQVDPKDTYYHEVVHKYLDTMTTMEEHKEALIAAKRYFGVDNWKDAEEQLAESFIGYAKKREGMTGKLKAIFDKLLGRFKNYTENKKAIKDFYGSIIEKKERSTSTKEIIPKNLPKEFKPRKLDKTKFNEKLNTSESVHSLVTKLAKSDEVKKEIQRRGKVSWKETTKQANAMGIDLKGLRKEAKNAPDFAARVESIKQIRANRASELHDYLSNIPRNPSVEQKAKISRKINEFLFVDRSLKSITAEHGRAINILKKEVEAQEFETYNKLIDDIIKIDPSKKDSLNYVKEIDKTINPHQRLFVNILNFPRSIMATADLSAPFRQGLFLINHPKIFAKSMKTMFKAALSEKEYQKASSYIEKRESYPQMQRDGLSIMELGEDISKREELIMSNLLEKIPGIGKIVRGSNRAYTVFLNNLRADSYDYFTKKAVDVGAMKRNPEIGKDIANFVNTATGRGSIKSIEKYAEVLNGTFFSPRLISSRLNLINPYYYYKLDPFVRKEALKSLFTLVGVGSTILSLAKMGGAEVGADPRSADFGKIKVGDTRIDIWGGFQQYAVLASRLISNEMVSSTTGREFTLGEGYKPTTRDAILAKFISYETSPVTSFAIGLFNGQNVMGDKFKVTDEIVRRSIPMLASDVYDLLEDKKSLGYAGPAIFGVGLQTYSKKIPFKGKTARGKRKIIWKEKPDLASAMVNSVLGNDVSSIPKNRWSELWKKKIEKDTAKAKVDNIKRRVLMTGKSESINGKHIYLKNGIVKVKK